MSKKIAIFGGAFNPITIGHRISAEYVLSYTDISEVWITPCFQHSYNKQMIDSNIRFEMCKLVCDKNKGLFANDFEIKKELSGPTYEMICILKDEFPNYDFSLIIGQDNANTIDKWVKYDKLLKISKFIVLPRVGYKPVENMQWYQHKPHIYLKDANIPETSSTDVRDYLKRKEFEKARNLLDDQVFKYIIKNKLFL